MSKIQMITLGFGLITYPLCILSWGVKGAIAATFLVYLFRSSLAISSFKKAHPDTKIHRFFLFSSSDLPWFLKQVQSILEPLRKKGVSLRLLRSN